MSEEGFFGEVVDSNDEEEQKGDMSSVSPVTFSVLITVERLLAVDIGDRWDASLSRTVVGNCFQVKPEKEWVASKQP